jgi:hypothetical protein
MRLTPRDFEILKYLYDQKFCSLECLYFRFFDARKPNDPIPLQMRVARQRLQVLKRCEFIKSQKVYSEAKSVYLIALRGYQALCGKYPNLVYGSPVKEVDFRNYDHDKRVNLVRIALEKSGKVLAWYPERKVRLEGFAVNGISRRLPETVIPDAIALTSEGKRIAVEVEASIRKKSRFRFKVDELTGAMLGDPPLIHSVLFVACSDALGKDLCEITANKKGFRVESYSGFTNYLQTGGKNV